MVGFLWNDQYNICSSSNDMTDCRVSVRQRQAPVCLSSAPDNVATAQRDSTTKSMKGRSYNRQPVGSFKKRACRCGADNVSGYLKGSLGRVYISATKLLLAAAVKSMNHIQYVFTSVFTYAAVYSNQLLSSEYIVQLFQLPTAIISNSSTAVYVNRPIVLNLTTSNFPRIMEISYDFENLIKIQTQTSFKALQRSRYFNYLKKCLHI